MKRMKYRILEASFLLGMIFLFFLLTISTAKGQQTNDYKDFRKALLDMEHEEVSEEMNVMPMELKKARGYSLDHVVHPQITILPDKDNQELMAPTVKVRLNNISNN